MSFTKHRIFLERKAEKQLKELTAEIRDKLMEKAAALKDGFLPSFDIKKLKGYGDHFRLGVGEYRILFEV